MPLLTLARLAAIAGAAPTRSVQKAVNKNSLMYKYKKWNYYQREFPKVGLRHDDSILATEKLEPIINEALRRLPKEEQYARHWRIWRAQYLCMNKQVLPKEEWIDYDTDEHYLQPYMDEVKFEIEERKLWDSQ